MRSYERNEVTVDQCTGCGGLFLDKGELERLSEAESTYYGNQQAHPLQQSGRQEGYEPKKKKKSKTSFLQDLFEG